MRYILIILTIAGLLYGGYEVSIYVDRKDKFFTALRKDDLKTVKKYIKRGMSLDIQDGAGQTPLHVAAYKGTPKTVKYLISKGASLKAVDRRGGTPLHWAAIKGDIDNVEVLLKKGANINIKDDSGATPLHWAVAGIGVLDIKKFVTVSFLLRNDADPNIRDENSKTALDMAIGKKNKVMIDLLKKETK